MVLPQVRAWILVLILHWKQLRLLGLLETLAELLILLRLVPIRQQEVQSLVSVHLGHGYVASILVQFHVYTLCLLLPDLVIELALAVVYEAVVRQLVLIEACWQVLPAHLLTARVLVL